VLKWKAVLFSLLGASISTVYIGLAADAADPSPPVAQPAVAPATQPSAARDISPEADRVLRRMSQFLAAQKSFRVHSVATTEQRAADGDLVQVSRNCTIAVQRPGMLAAEARIGPQVRMIWHQGKQLTVLDVPTKKYATIETPERINDMLDLLADKYGVIVPLDDFLYPDPYATLTEHAETGTYVDQQKVGQNDCDHLLFTQANLDWQIWIDAGNQPVPRKIVITYKDAVDKPQFEAVLDQWEIGLPEGSVSFAPKLPTGAEQVAPEALMPQDDAQ
jgi:hypothetical protein